MQVVLRLPERHKAGLRPAFAEQRSKRLWRFLPRATQQAPLALPTPSNAVSAFGASCTEQRLFTAVAPAAAAPAHLNLGGPHTAVLRNKRVFTPSCFCK